MSEIEQPEIELLANGKIRARIADTTHMLRRPTIGEFRKMRESLYDLQDAIRALPQELADQTKALEVRITKAKNETDLAALNEELRNLNRSGSRFDALYISQMRELFVLSDHALPEADDDLPLWMAAPRAPGGFLDHWRDSPLASGEL